MFVRPVLTYQESATRGGAQGLSFEHIISRHGAIANTLKISDRSLNGRINSGLLLNQTLNGATLNQTGLFTLRSLFYTVNLGGPFAGGFAYGAFSDFGRSVGEGFYYVGSSLYGNDD